MSSSKKKDRAGLDPAPMLTVAGVAAHTNTSTTTVRRLIAEGAFPVVRVRGQVRIAASDLAIYLSAQRSA